jgi:hypothetical protein
MPSGRNPTYLRAAGFTLQISIYKTVRAGETEKKFEHEKSLKKNSCRDFSIGKIISCVSVAPKFGK